MNILIWKASSRAFSSLPSTNKTLYDFEFTSEFKFRDKGDKLNCFWVIDEEGKLVNDKKFVDNIPKEKLLKIYETMVLNNEVDLIFNMAQR